MLCMTCRLQPAFTRGWSETFRHLKKNTSVLVLWPIFPPSFIKQIRLDAAWEQCTQVYWGNIFVSTWAFQRLVLQAQSIKLCKHSKGMKVCWFSKKSVVMFCVCSVCCSSSRGRYLRTCNELCVRLAHKHAQMCDSTRELQIQSFLPYSTCRRQATVGRSMTCICVELRIYICLKHIEHCKKSSLGPFVYMTESMECNHWL